MNPLIVCVSRHSCDKRSSSPPDVSVDSGDENYDGDGDGDDDGTDPIF